MMKRVLGSKRIIDLFPEKRTHTLVIFSSITNPTLKVDP